MRVLDIDLDFFLADCCPLADKGRRPALKGREPWEADKVISFLEGQCGLDTHCPVPGKVFETHDMALDYWEGLIKEGRLSIPFEVTHVDAHSDLGIGRPGPSFVLNNVLAMQPEKRPDLKRYRDMVKLDEGNYLLFALAFRWISSLENIRAPLSRPDIPPVILACGRDDLICMSSLPSKLMEVRNGPEPAIPFSVYQDYTVFRAAGRYDFVSLAMSPRYTPEAADPLANVISRYFRMDTAL